MIAKRGVGGQGMGGRVWIAAIGLTLDFIMEPFNKVGV